MISNLVRVFTAVALFCLAGDAKGAEGEELFKKASAFYGRNFNSPPWPTNEPSGFQLLTASADAKYPLALHNMFLGYKLGFFGYPNERKATEYRIKWLIALDTPSSCLQLARGYLGIWSPVREPSGANPKLPDGCIFVGEIALKERRLGVPETAFFGVDGNDNRDEERFVFFSERAIDLALSRTANRADREAGTTAVGLLIDAITGIPIPGTEGRKLKLDASHTWKASVLRTIVRAMQRSVINRERAIPALVTLFDALPNEELLTLFKADQKANNL